MVRSAFAAMDQHMLDLLEIIAAAGEVVFSWRFFLCVVLSLGAIAATHWLLSDRSLCLSVSVLLAAVSIIGGFVWQWRNDKAS
jgi:hypothetical protein